MVTCGQCGHQNPLGHLFCMQCRSKLDLKKHADTEMLSLPRSRRFGLKSVLVFVAVIIAGFMFLMFRPVGLDPVAASGADFQSACRKLNTLGSVSGAGALVFTEKEVAAYMQAVVDRAKMRVRSGGDGASVQSIDLFLHDGEMTLKVVRTFRLFAVGPVNLGSARLEYALTGVPEFGESGFRFRLDSGRAGRLPLPRPLGLSVLSELEAFFSRQEKERTFLDRIGEAKVMDGKVSVSMGW